MDKKIEGILLQIVKNLEKNNGWMVDKDWQLTYKTDGYISLVRSIEIESSMDQTEWNDQVATAIHVKMTSEDEWTYWASFTVYAQIKIADIDSEDIAYKMTSNVAFMSDDVKDETKSSRAAREINTMAQTHISKSYQAYVDKNKEMVKYYMQASGGGTPSGD